MISCPNQDTAQSGRGQYELLPWEFRHKYEHVITAGRQEVCHQRVGPGLTSPARAPVCDSMPWLEPGGGRPALTVSGSENSTSALQTLVGDSISYPARTTWSTGVPVVGLSLALQPYLSSPSSWKVSSNKLKALTHTFLNIC